MQLYQKVDNLRTITYVDADGNYQGSTTVYGMDGEQIAEPDLSAYDPNFAWWTAGPYYNPNGSMNFIGIYVNGNTTLYANYRRLSSVKSGLILNGLPAASLVQIFHACQSSNSNPYLPAHTIDISTTVNNQNGKYIFPGETVYIKLKRYYMGYEMQLGSVTISCFDKTSNSTKSETITANTVQAFVDKGCSDKIASFVMPDSDFVITALTFAAPPVIQPAVGEAITATGRINSAAYSSSVSANYGDLAEFKAAGAGRIALFYSESDMPYSKAETPSYTNTYSWYVKAPDETEYKLITGAAQSSLVPGEYPSCGIISDSYRSGFYPYGNVEGQDYSYRCVVRQTRSDNQQYIDVTSNGVTVNASKHVQKQTYYAYSLVAEGARPVKSITVAIGKPVTLYATNTSYEGSMPITYSSNRPGTYHTEFYWYEKVNGEYSFIGKSDTDRFSFNAPSAVGEHRYVCVSRQIRTDITTNSYNYRDFLASNEVVVSVQPGTVSAAAVVNGSASPAAEVTANHGDTLLLSGSVTLADGYSASYVWYRCLNDEAYAWEQVGSTQNLSLRTDAELRPADLATGLLFRLQIAVTKNGEAAATCIDSNVVTVNIDKYLSPQSLFIHINNSEGSLWNGSSEITVVSPVGFRLWVDNTNYCSSPSDIAITHSVSRPGSYTTSYQWYEKLATGDVAVGAGSASLGFFEASFGRHEYYCVVTDTRTDLTSNGNNSLVATTPTVAVNFLPYVYSLGAQAKLDGGSLRFGMRISAASLQKGLEPGDFISMGMLVNAKSKLDGLSSVVMTGEEDGTRNVVLVDALVWTAEMDEMDDLQLAAALRAQGFKVFNAYDGGIELVLAVVGMNGHEDMSIVFRPYVDVVGGKHYTVQKYNSIQRILNAYNTGADGFSVVYE